VIKDSEDKARRLLLCIKTNIGKEPQGLAYTLEQRLAGYINEPPEPLHASTVVWDSTPVAKSADQAIADHEASLRGQASGRPSPETDEAEAFLRACLADGPKNAREVTKAARDAGVNVGKPLRKARERLCETVQTRSDDGKVVAGWLWKLKPEHATQSGEE
jgi:hypothetical protein